MLDSKIYPLKEPSFCTEESGESVSSSRKPLSAVESQSQSAFTFKLLVFRICVVSCLLITAVSSGLGAYLLLDFYETERYESNFRSISSQIDSRIGVGMDRAVQSSAQTSVYLGLIHNNKDKWPYVYTPSFGATYAQLEKITGISLLGFAPVFNSSLVTSFNKYFNEVNMNFTGSSSSFQVRTMFGKNNDTSGELVAPIINSEPHRYASLVDVYNDALFEGRVTSVMNCVRNDVNASFWQTSRCISLSHVQSVPGSDVSIVTLLSPIFPQRFPNDFCGVTVTALEVVDFFQDATPDYVTGLDFVVYTINAGGEQRGMLTLTVDDGVVSVKCEDSDCYYEKYDSLYHHKEVHIDNAALSSFSLAFDIYPTSEFYNQHHSRNRFLMAFWSALLFAFAIALFFVYDHFVQVESFSKQHVLETRRRLVRFVSHEIRTPLNTVILGLDLLYHLISNTEVDNDSTQDFCEGEETNVVTVKTQDQIKCDTQEDLDLLNDVKSSTTAAVTVLNDLLDYDAIEMDLMEINLQPIFALEFLENAIRQFNIQARQGCVDIICSLKRTADYLDNQNEEFWKATQFMDESQGEKFLSINGSAVALSSFCFMGDRHRLVQVIRNLISNALKFTPKGGRINITALWKEIEETDAKIKNQCATVLFAVHDNGAGISKCNLKLLFGEGVQFDANRLQEGRGSGLGLYISKEIVAAHNGNIWAQSEGEGLGSCFFIELPIVNFSPEAIEGSALKQMQLTKAPSFHRISSVEKSLAIGRHSSSGSFESNNTPNVIIIAKTKHILVVDDVPSNRKMVCRMLEVNGFTAEQAVDGVDCLKIVTALRDINMYDCILMDYLMPNMDGPDATRELRALGYVHPIIGLTGNLMIDDVNHFIECGADTVMAKPFNLDTFKAMIVDEI